MSDITDAHRHDESADFDREQRLDAETIVEDAVELFEKPVQSPADDTDAPPPG